MTDLEIQEFILNSIKDKFSTIINAIGESNNNSSINFSFEMEKNKENIIAAEENSSDWYYAGDDEEEDEEIEEDTQKYMRRQSISNQKDFEETCKEYIKKDMKFTIEIAVDTTYDNINIKTKMILN